MHVDSPKVIVETAERRGIFVTGYHANQAALAPKGYLTGAEWNWAKVYTDYVDLGAGRARPTPTCCAAASRKASSRCRPTARRCPPRRKKKADEAKAKLTDGTLVIYKGPLKDNTGKVVIAAGSRAGADRHRAREDELPGRGRGREDPVLSVAGRRWRARSGRCDAARLAPSRDRGPLAEVGSLLPAAAIAAVAGAVRRVRGAGRGQPAGGLRRDVPGGVRHLVLVPEHAAAGGAADADGPVHGAARAPGAGRDRRRGGAGAGRAGRGRRPPTPPPAAPTGGADRRWCWPAFVAGGLLDRRWPARCAPCAA